MFVIPEYYVYGQKCHMNFIFIGCIKLGERVKPNQQSVVKHTQLISNFGIFKRLDEYIDLY